MRLCRSEVLAGFFLVTGLRKAFRLQAVAVGRGAKEMYTAAANSDRVTVDIMLPPDQAADIRTKIASGVWDDIRKKFQEVNVEHAKAREKKDEDMVKEHIKKGAGFDAVNAKVREKMMAWVLKQVEMFLLEDGKVRSGADFLRTAGLADYIDKLEEQGVCTFEDLEDLEIPTKSLH